MNKCSSVLCSVVGHVEVGKAQGRLIFIFSCSLFDGREGGEGEREDKLDLSICLDLLTTCLFIILQTCILQ